MQLESSTAQHNTHVSTYLYAKSALRVPNNPATHTTTLRDLARSRCLVLRDLLRVKSSLDSADETAQTAAMKRLLESLTDHISFGHFRLLREYQQETHLLAAMASNTDQLLVFLDAHGADSQAPYSSRLASDLEALAWHLEARFDIEDDVISSGC